MVLPKIKVPVEKLPTSVMTLAQKVAKRIKTKLRPDEIKIESFAFQDYPAINIIPIYKDQKLEQKTAEEKELNDLRSKLEKKHRQPRIRKEKSKLSDKDSLERLPKINFRIP